MTGVIDLQLNCHLHWLYYALMQIVLSQLIQLVRLSGALKHKRRTNCIIFSKCSMQQHGVVCYRVLQCSESRSGAIQNEWYFSTPMHIAYVAMCCGHIHIIGMQQCKPGIFF